MLTPSPNFELSIPAQDLLGAVNSPQKALIHLSVDDPNKWHTPNELDAAFMKLQGDDPVWKTSRGYVRAMLLGHPIEAGTFAVTEEGPKSFRITERGVDVGATIAAHLLVLADQLNARPCFLIGEKTAPSQTDTLNPAQIRFRTMHALAEMGTTPFCCVDLVTSLGMSHSSASGITTEFAGVGFLEKDPSKKPTRNQYATFAVSDAFAHHSDTEPDDELETLVREVIHELHGVDEIDARVIARELGYNIKYAGKDIANILDELHANGELTMTAEPQDRSGAYRLTEKGAIAIKGTLDIFRFAADPTDTDFISEGHDMKRSIVDDPTMVRQLLMTQPTKRGQKRVDLDRGIKDMPAEAVLMTRINGHTHLTTKQVQQLVGTSRAATGRILRQAASKGLVTREKRGREYIWSTVTQ